MPVDPSAEGQMTAESGKLSPSEDGGKKMAGGAPRRVSRPQETTLDHDAVQVGG